MLFSSTPSERRWPNPALRGPLQCRRPRPWLPAGAGSGLLVAAGSHGTSCLRNLRPLGHERADPPSRLTRPRCERHGSCRVCREDMAGRSTATLQYAARRNQLSSRPLRARRRRSGERRHNHGGCGGQAVRLPPLPAARSTLHADRRHRIELPLRIPFGIHAAHLPALTLGDRRQPKFENDDNTAIVVQ